MRLQTALQLAGSLYNLQVKFTTVAKLHLLLSCRLYSGVAKSLLVRAKDAANFGKSARNSNTGPDIGSVFLVFAPAE